MCLCMPQGLRQACPPADELADNGRGWLSEHGMVVQPSAMPAARQDACVLQSLVGRMLQQPVLAASMYDQPTCLPAAVWLSQVLAPQPQSQALIVDEQWPVPSRSEQTHMLHTHMPRPSIGGLPGCYVICIFFAHTRFAQR